MFSQSTSQTKRQWKNMQKTLLPEKSHMHILLREEDVHVWLLRAQNFFSP